MNKNNGIYVPKPLRKSWSYSNVVEKIVIACVCAAISTVIIIGTSMIVILLTY